MGAFDIVPTVLGREGPCPGAEHQEWVLIRYSISMLKFHGHLQMLASTLLHKLRVTQCFIGLLCVLTEVPSSAGLYTDQQGLLAFKQAIPDFDLNQRRGEFPGWSDDQNDNYCRWFGVTCDNGNVVGLQLPQNASWYRGEQ